MSLAALFSTLCSLGPVTQLVECHPYKVEVASSSLAGTTIIFFANPAKLLDFNIENTEPAVLEGTPMKLKVQISESCQVKLKEIIAEFNSWPYRLNDIKLKNNQLEIDLDNIPVFWDQFLEGQTAIKNELRLAIIDAMREVPEEQMGVSFKKAMVVLSSIE